MVAQVKSFYEQKYPYVFENDPSGHGAVLKYDSNSTYRPEEMVAFVLSYAKQIAEGHAGTSIKDAVITVPPFFGHIEVCRATTPPRYHAAALPRRRAAAIRMPSLVHLVHLIHAAARCRSAWHFSSLTALSLHIRAPRPWRRAGICIVSSAMQILNPTV